ncbi:MAG: hypothetical protein Q4B26_05820 [Eubacteriales bacterium]|nr:hypothetical protein [Eubacteriales bacterium]
MYKCGNCGGPLKYDIETGKLKCTYCGDSHTVTQYARTYKAATESLSVFTCPFCGGEIITNDTAITDFCSYCGSPAILERREESREMPVKIVPFTLTLGKCENIYKKYIEKMPYLPKEYKAENGAVDFRGIYVPYHSYDTSVVGEYTYKGRRDMLISPSGKKHKVDEYSAKASVNGKVKRIIHDASENFVDKTSEEITFARDTGVEFHPAYLSGFYSDYADSPAEKYYDFAREVTRNASRESVEKSIKSEKKDLELTYEKQSVNIQIEKSHQILRPIWFMSRKTGNRVAYAAVDGSSGRAAADLPIDMKKFVILSLALSAVLFLFLDIALTVTPKTMNTIVCALNMVLTLVYMNNVKKIYQREISTEEKPETPRRKGNLSTRTLVGITAFCILVLVVMSYIGSSIGVVFLLLQIAAFAAGYKKWTAVEKSESRPTKWIFASFLSTILLIVLRTVNPVQDIWYYIGGGVSLAVTVIVLLRTIADYNLICTKPFPQFAAYKGGMQNDER